MEAEYITAGDKTYCWVQHVVTANKDRYFLDCDELCGTTRFYKGTVLRCSLCPTT